MEEQRDRSKESCTFNYTKNHLSEWFPKTIRKRNWLLIIILCVIFSACAMQQQEEEHTETTDPSQQTVDNIFAQPDDTEPASTPINELYLGSISHGPIGEKLIDEVGAYRLYEGGEMHIAYDISAQGLQDYGIGILLFVDGYPQPYKTTTNDTYAYMHTFDLNIRGYVKDELIFAPVVGEAGDTLEIYTLNINYPEYFAGESDFGFAHTSGSVAAGTRLMYQETPGIASFPDASVCASEFTKEYIDLTSKEISGWSDEKLQSEVKWKFCLNREEGGTIGIRYSEQLEIYFEIWGNSDIEFGLVLYLNNEPVLIDGIAMVEIDIENGKKTVVNLNIPTEGMDENSVFYAVLVQRNYRTTDAGTSCYIQTTSTFYISCN